MSLGGQMPDWLDWGEGGGGGQGAFCPPYKIGSQNTPYKLGLSLLM